MARDCAPDGRRALRSVSQFPRPAGAVACRNGAATSLANQPASSRGSPIRPPHPRCSSVTRVPPSTGSSRTSTSVNSSVFQSAWCHWSRISSPGFQETTRPTSNSPWTTRPFVPASKLIPPRARAVASSSMSTSNATTGASAVSMLTRTVVLLSSIVSLLTFDSRIFLSKGEYQRESYFHVLTQQVKSGKVQCCYAFFDKGLTQSIFYEEVLDQSLFLQGKRL